MPKKIDRYGDAPYTGQDTREEIQICLSCRRKECTNCLKYQHSPRTPRSSWDVGELKSFLDAGWSVKQLSRHYGKDEHHIYTIINYYRKRGRL